jgi:hypothetical protein
MKTNTTEPTGPAYGTCMIHSTDICCTGERGAMTGRGIIQEISAAVVPIDEQTTGSLGYSKERTPPEPQGGAG